MEDIKCPRCNRKAKLTECVCQQKNRKRIMLHFPCYHFTALVYNVPCAMDDNAIIKDFKSISKDYFGKTHYEVGGDKYLNS